MARGTEPEAQLFVGTVHAPEGKVVVIKENHGTLTLSDGRTLKRRFVGVPLLRQTLFGRDQEIIDKATVLLQLLERGSPGATGGLVGQINAAGGKVLVVAKNDGFINM